MEFLRLFSKITLIGQIILYGALFFIAIPMMFIEMSGSMVILLPLFLLLAYVKMMGIALIVAMPILIILAALGLRALNNKSSIKYKKVIMTIYLVLGVLWAIMNILQSGETVLSGLVVGIMSFIIFFLPIILYLYMYINKKEKGEKLDLEPKKFYDYGVTEKEKSDYERKVKWTKIFCVIIGILAVLFNNIIAATIILIALYFFYKFTKERKIAGPIIGICISILYILNLNILSILLGIFILVDCIAMIKYIQKVTRIEAVEEYRKRETGFENDDN